MFRTAAAAAVVLVLALAFLLLLLPGCQTVQTPPSVTQEPIPEFKPEPPAPPTPPEPPKEYLLVTGSAVNLRKGPSTKDATIGRARKGDRLQVVGEQGDWYEVRLASGAPAFLSSKFARRDGDCPPDSAAPKVLTAPPMEFAEGSAHGLVQLKLAVDATGSVTGVTVVQNMTGDDALAQKARTEAQGMKFAPLIRKCRPSPFTYVFNRMY